MGLRDLKKVQQAFPREGVDKRDPKRPKERWLVILDQCKEELTDLCLSFCRREKWRPPSDVVYRKRKLPARRKKDHPREGIPGTEYLSSGEESEDELPLNPYELMRKPAEECTPQLTGK